MAVYLRLISIFFALVGCGAFYVGMFKDNDYLVAQDRLYKERVPYRTNMAKYGRVFKCQITYIRAVDRLGYGRPPSVQIIRGGLQKKFVVLHLLSYNKPISVNVYVGCANKEKTTTTKTVTTPESKEISQENGEGSKADKDITVATIDTITVAVPTDQTDSNVKEGTTVAVGGEGATGDNAGGEGATTEPGDAQE